MVVANKAELIAEQLLSGNLAKKTWGDIIFNVKLYGARGDGVHDDTAAIQKAINAAETSGGGTVFFPSGDYRYTSLTITESKIHLVGNGKSSRLVQSSAADHGLVFHNPSVTREYVKVENLSFDSSVPKTSGIALNFLDYVYCMVESCYFEDQFDCIAFSTYQYMFLSNCYFQNNKGADVTLTFGDGCFITNCMLQNSSITPGSIGLMMKSAGGTNLINCDVTNHDYGILIRPDTGQSAQWTFISNSGLDTCNHGLFADNSAGGTINSIDSVNSWYSSNKERGIDIRGVDGFSSSNDRVLLNSSDGVLVGSGCKNVQFNNSQIAANGIDPATGFGAGIFIFGDVDSCSVRGCVVTNDYAGSFGYQNYGVLIGAGASDNLIITENYVLGNVDASISDNSSGTNKIIKNNIGYMTENSGISTQSGNGAETTFNIPHGLAKIPTFVSVTPGSNDAASDFYVAADTVNIVVIYKIAPAAGANNLVFRWRSEV